MRKTQYLLYALFFAAGLAAATLLSHVSAGGAIHKQTLPPASASIARIQRGTNAWGTIQALRIPLTDSENFFPDRAARLQPPRWFFESFSQNQVIEFLNSCSLTEPQKTELFKAPWLVASNGMEVLPAIGLVQSLSSGSRERIYAVLARSAVNYPQRFPFRFSPVEFEARLNDSGLSPDKMNTLRSLIYTNGGSLCFADLQVLPDILSAKEFKETVESLYELPTYRLRLRIYPDSDIDALVAYWGKHDRTKKIRPLLESLARIPNEAGTSTGIGFLLPPFARARLNTFPEAWTEPQTNREDCFWTSMNFFNDQPDMRFLDADYVANALKNECEPVNGSPAFGDLVTLVDEAGAPIHICVYIAEDFVFTKNGMNRLAPWVLMKIPDMLLGFSGEKPPRMMILRRKA